MQCLEVSGAVRLIYRSLGVKGLKPCGMWGQIFYKTYLSAGYNIIFNLGSRGSL